MKTILIVNDNLPDQVNGVVTTYKNVGALASRDGYSVVHINPGMFTHFDCPGYKEVKISLCWGLGKKIEEIAPDYIHIATEGPLGMAARQYLDKHKYRYNTAYHTKFPEALKKIFGVPESISWKMVQWFHNHSGKVLTTTDSMVEELQSHGFKNNVISWTRGVDRDIFKPADRKQNEAPILLCVSRVSKEKNLEDFFKLDYPRCQKIMVGDGPMLEEYKKQYPNVFFAGLKRGKELAKYYQQADVFVFPSCWDTFGIVMIESMACGTPVAAYPVQGPVDVVESGKTGYLRDSLPAAVDLCLSLDRSTVVRGSQVWSWESAWEIFRDNLIECRG